MPPVAHLYIHVPFCAAKCRYCAFYSAPATRATMADFVPALLAELRPHRSRLRPRTIFIGGGTPSLLPLPLWDALLTGLRQSLPLAGVNEWTIECNPATVNTAKARFWRAAGVNRLSLGVQSFDDRHLQVLGRRHTARQARATYWLLRRAGFTNLNLDLMFGLPGQTAADWAATLRYAIALQPEHISAYCLTREEGTALANLPADDDRDRELFELTIATLTAAGYRHYEISNFAKPGHECRHNLAYWRGADFLGLGPSAVSTVGPRRWQDVPDTARYLAATINHQPSTISEERLTPALRRAERAAFGLRMTAGVPARLVRGRWDDEIAVLLRDGLVQWHRDRLRLTPRGLLFADEVAAAFV